MGNKLYIIGIGPGDPELITIKAKRILAEVDVVAVPKTSAEKASLAQTIAEGAFEKGKELLELLFPMSFDEKVLEKSWKEAIGKIREKLEKGKSVAFITLGDPTVYSTYMYIHKQLHKEGYATEIIPGITSFCASAARAGISLGENRESIAIVPSAYDCDNLENVLKSFDNIVLMKVSKNISKLKELLKAQGLLEKSVLVSKCGLEDEKITYDLDSLDGERISYFTTMIVKKSGVR
ncbi:MAG: precorrin-2 C(20)-methyltransferase [Clostridia bacterium]